MGKGKKKKSTLFIYVLILHISAFLKPSETQTLGRFFCSLYWCFTVFPPLSLMQLWLCHRNYITSNQVFKPKVMGQAFNSLRWRPVNLSVSSSGPYRPNQKLQTGGTNCSNQNHWLSKGYPAHLCQSVKGSAASVFVIHNLCSVLWGKEFSSRNWVTVDTTIGLSCCPMIFQAIDEEN